MEIRINRPTWIFDGRFVDEDGVVRSEVWDDEPAVDIDRYVRVQPGQEPEDVTVEPASIVGHELDEVPLRRFRHQVEAVPERVLLGSESVVGWNEPLRVSLAHPRDSQWGEVSWNDQKYVR